jgi:beta-glucanase (GH16 family)
MTIRNVAGVLAVLASVAGPGSSGQAAETYQPVAVPVLAATAALHGAVVVSLKDATVGAVIHYTEDGSVPSEKSAQYFAPFLVASAETVKAVAVRDGVVSDVASQTFAVDIAPGTLVWSEEFSNTTGVNAEPDPELWHFEAGGPGRFGNHELETYCDRMSKKGPCDPAKPNAYVGTDGYLHIVARHPADGVYTSARMTTEGRFSVGSGRVEARIRIPEGRGYWPAFWLLGNDIRTVNWPACGELDVMEHINAPTPDWVEGSVHGTGFIGAAGLGTKTYAPAGQSFAGWHTYGMIWSKGTIAYYVDDAARPYVTYTADDIRKFKDAVWPFSDGQSEFLLFNLAVGGDWPKSPDATTQFPGEMLVDYVRVYRN